MLKRNLRKTDLFVLLFLRKNVKWFYGVSNQFSARTTRALLQNFILIMVYNLKYETQNRLSVSRFLYSPLADSVTNNLLL
jgi:hypothetical protein